MGKPALLCAPDGVFIFVRGAGWCRSIDPVSYVVCPGWKGRPVLEAPDISGYENSTWK